MMYFIKNALAALLIASSLQADEVPFAYNSFDAKVYDAYLAQLQAFVETKLKNYPKSSQTPEWLQIANLIQAGPLSAAPEEKARFHETLIDQLRSNIALRNGDFIDELSLWIYSEPSILHPMREFLTAAFPKEMDSLTTLDHLGALYNKIDDDSRFKGTLPSPEQPYDAHRYGDVPSYLFSIPLEEKEIAVIRFPNTTFERWLDPITKPVETHILPEFINYLSIMKAKGKTHLYLNYLPRKDEPSKVIEKLDRDPLLGTSLSVVSLARNSPFYAQEAPYRNLNDAQAFKDTFLKELLDDSAASHYYWPQALDRSRWKATLHDILDEVHARYFSQDEELAIGERKEFIDIVNLHIAKALLFTLRPDAVNLTCRISIDRGPTAYALLFADLQIEKKGTLDKEDLSTIAVLTYGPGVVFRNRSIDRKHNDRFLKAAKMLLENPILDRSYDP